MQPKIDPVVAAGNYFSSLFFRDHINNGGGFKISGTSISVPPEPKKVDPVVAAGNYFSSLFFRDHIKNGGGFTISGTSICIPPEPKILER